MRDGVINILKAPGMTSNDVVYDIRRALGIKRVGHTGTLDPGACGVLPVCIGKATRLFDYLAEKEKEYITEVTFGKETDTLDSYGSITAHCDRIIEEEDILSVIPEFMGEIEQTAPMYSAVSVNGERLYKLARRGIEVERKKRRVTVSKIELIRKCGANSFLFKTRCSKGTYIRTLFSDIAHSLNSCAYVSFLLRSASGRFNIEDSVTINEVREALSRGDENSLILPVHEALDFMPKVVFKDNEQIKKRLINGASIRFKNDNKLIRVFCDEQFLGIGECEDGCMRIKTRFCEEIK